jgi:ribosomal protein S27AE
MPLEAFYRHSQMADGHLNFCRACVRAQVRRYRQENDSVREYDRERDRLPHRVALRAEIGRRWRIANPEKYRAETAVGNAIRDGKLKRKPCVECGEKLHVHAHHDNYSRPLAVRWLCARCHRRAHMRKNGSKPQLQLKSSAAVEILWRNGYTRPQISEMLGLSDWSVRFHLQAGGWVPHYNKKRKPITPPRPIKGRPAKMPDELRVLASRYGRANP